MKIIMTSIAAISMLVLSGCSFQGKPFNNAVFTDKFECADVGWGFMGGGIRTEQKTCVNEQS